MLRWNRIQSLPPRRGICAFKGLWQNRRGGALIEFVVVLPVLLMLLFGVWEFGRIFDAWLVSTNASREGARYAAEWVPTDGPLQNHVRSKVVAYLNSGYGARVDLGAAHVRPNNRDVHIPPTNIDIQELSGQVRVVVHADVDIWAPALDALAGGPSFRVTAWTTMRQ